MFGLERARSFCLPIREIREVQEQVTISLESLKWLLNEVRASKLGEGLCVRAFLEDF